MPNNRFIRIGLCTFTLLSVVATCPSFSQAIRFAPTSDYRFLSADLGAFKEGTAFHWAVNGKPVAESVVAETFLLASDGTMVSVWGQSPVARSEETFTPGRFDRAFVAPQGGVSYLARGAFNRRQGTMEFWVSPLRDGNDLSYGVDQAFFFYAAPNGDTLRVGQASTGVVCAQAIIGGVYLSAYSDAGSMKEWKAGSWHHVVFVYSDVSNFMRMFVDGKPAGDTNEKHYRPPVAASEQSRFALGNPAYAIDSVRFTAELFDANRISTEAARRTAPFKAETVFPLFGLNVGDEVEIAAGSTRGSFRFLGSPISRAAPDTGLLPTGSTSVRLSAASSVPAELRWSVGENLPFEQMTPFASGKGGTAHETMIAGLSPNPATVNAVYLRSSTAPDFSLELWYRSVPRLEPDYPRIASLWSWRLGQPEYADYVAGLQLAVPGFSDPEALRTIRRINPDIVLLATLQPVEYFEGEDPIPESYYLHDVSGQRITLWPGSFRLNLTNPDVVAFNVERVRRTMLGAELLFDGVFFDSFMLGVSFYKTDSYGKPIKIDADGDGKEDDPVALDEEWKAGLLRMVRLWSESMPGAINSGHLLSDPVVLGPDFDGDNLAFMCVDAIEGRRSFDEIWSQYHAWSLAPIEPTVTVVDVGAPNELGYGYGVYSSFQEAELRIPPGVMSFARDWYPSMRFGLAFTLMGNGLFERHFSDVIYCEEWWYDEFDFCLGAPLGEARYAAVNRGPASTSRPIFIDGSLEKPSSAWQLFTHAEGGAAASLSYESDVVSSARAARIDIAAIPTTTQSHYVNFYRSAIAVKKGVSYRVAFSAKADRPRSIAVSLQRRAGEWEGLGLWKRIALNTEWQEYSVSFTATGDRSDAGLQFFLADEIGTVFIDDVTMVELPPNVWRRDFERGTVLLNGTSERVTVRLEAGYARFSGAQAPRYQYIVDENEDDVRFEGRWTAASYNTEEWKALPPFYHDWGPGCRESTDRTAFVEYALAIPETGVYTIRAWLSDAPNRVGRTGSAIYEILVRGKVVASTSVDQGANHDAWYDIGRIALDPKDKPTLRLRNAAGGILYADAIYLESEARYNDGSPSRELTLEPFDGIILRKR